MFHVNFQSYYVKTILIILLSFVLLNETCLAKTIVLNGKTIINQPTSYENVDLDLSNGYFHIIDNATLKIKNSEIKGTISASNPYFINVSNGNVILENNIFNVQTRDIESTPKKSPYYKVIHVKQGKLSMIGNDFSIDKPFTVALLMTERIPTSDFIIKNNKVYNFHGGFMLSNTSNAFVAGNLLSNVSVTNLFTLNGHENTFTNNIILFSGNNNIGNGVDIIDSDNVLLNKNYISFGSCYSVVILRSRNILIDNNRIIGGITHAIYITSTIGLTDSFNTPFIVLDYEDNKKPETYQNKNITITNNYFGQNRFGIAAINVNNLYVKGNVFIQRFTNNNSRQFWTNTDNLFNDVINLTWENNIYKEAFVQSIKESNNISLKYVSYPSRGGVIL